VVVEGEVPWLDLMHPWPFETNFEKVELDFVAEFDQQWMMKHLVAVVVWQEVFQRG
jgi:hypothetical protein